MEHEAESIYVSMLLFMNFLKVFAEKYPFNTYRNCRVYLATKQHWRVTLCGATVQRATNWKPLALRNYRGNEKSVDVILR